MDYATGNDPGPLYGLLRWSQWSATKWETHKCHCCLSVYQYSSSSLDKTTSNRVHSVTHICLGALTCLTAISELFMDLTHTLPPPLICLLWSPPPQVSSFMTAQSGLAMSRDADICIPTLTSEPICLRRAALSWNSKQQFIMQQTVSYWEPLWHARMLLVW